jgi:hypothetical protein
MGVYLRCPNCQVGSVELLPLWLNLSIRCSARETIRAWASCPTITRGRKCQFEATIIHFPSMRCREYICVNGSALIF